MKPLARIQNLAKFLAHVFSAPEAASREQELLRAQAVLMALEAGHRADLVLTSADADALADTLDSITNAGENLTRELFALLPLPESLLEAAPPAEHVETEAPKPEHLPGTNGAAAAYVMDAIAKAEELNGKAEAVSG